MSDPTGLKCGRGARVVLACLVLAAFLTGCGRGSTGIEGEFSPPSGRDLVPMVLVPGISREVAGVLRGGSLVPFSALSLRTDAEAVANLGDPRFPADRIPAMEAPAMLDRALRGTDVRGF